MNTTKKLIACAFVVLTFAGCAGGMTHQERDTVVGAGVAETYASASCGSASSRPILGVQALWEMESA